MTDDIESKRRAAKREANRTYHLRNREKRLAQKKAWYAANRDWQAALLAEDRTNRPQRYMLRAARYRAKRKGIPFSITEADITIPAVCPVLGIPLELAIGTGGAAPNSPSLDRLDSSKGYTADNVCVISYRANALKNNATEQELEAVLTYVRRYRK